MQSGGTPNFCPRCGTRTSTGARYCIACGASFALPQAATAAVISDAARAVELPCADAPAKEQSSWFARWGWSLWAAISILIVILAKGTGSFGYSFGLGVGYYGASVAFAAVPTALVLLVNYLRKVKWRAESYLWILFVTGSVIAGLASIGNKMTEETMKRLDRDRRSEMPMTAPRSIGSAEPLQTTAAR